jgi:hypothetical protein
MKRLLISFSMIISILFLGNNSSLFAVEYPIISVGINGGWGQNELTKGTFGRIFLRYSLEAYIPGFQVEVGYAGSYYNVLSDSMTKNPENEERRIKTRIYNNYPALTGTFHLRPFGESTIIYFGGGAQIHFLSADRKTKDRYWDDEAEKYQEIEVAKATLLDQTKFGYHFLGGLRFVLGGFGTVDLEVRQTFLDISATDWDDKEASTLWGEKSWNNLSVNLGLTIYIF